MPEAVQIAEDLRNTEVQPTLSWQREDDANGSRNKVVGVITPKNQTLKDNPDSTMSIDKLLEERYSDNRQTLDYMQMLNRYRGEEIVQYLIDNSVIFGDDMLKLELLMLLVLSAPSEDGLNRLRFFVEAKPYYDGNNNRFFKLIGAVRTLSIDLVHKALTSIPSLPEVTKVELKPRTLEDVDKEVMRMEIDSSGWLNDFCELVDKREEREVVRLEKLDQRKRQVIEICENLIQVCEICI